MIKTEPNKTYINREPLENIMRIPYDAREDLDRMEHSLDWSLNAKPLFNFNTNSEENTARVQSWHDARLAEIASAQQRYQQRLEQARKSGAIDASDYSRALMDLHCPTNPFEKARRDANEVYRKESKL